jgi:hypothetical protein
VHQIGQLKVNYVSTWGREKAKERSRKREDEKKRGEKREEENERERKLYLLVIIISIGNEITFISNLLLEGKNVSNTDITYVYVDI